MLATPTVLQIDIAEAQSELLHLLDLANSGKEIILTQNNRPVAKLVSIISGRSLFGSDKGKIVMSDDFDAPLAEFEEY